MGPARATTHGWKQRPTRRTALAAISLTVMLATAACAGTGANPSSSSGGEVGPGDPVAGAVIYGATCSTCHGMDLQGRPGLGSGLAPNAFVASHSEESLVDFFKVGRPTSDPNNDQGIPMPPRGGNPTLTDQDLANVAAYLKAEQNATG